MDYSFSTQRLVADEWHRLQRKRLPDSALPGIVQSLLVPSVTASLPGAWQGPYDLRRAEQWVRERDAEGTTLLVIERVSSRPVGLLIFHEDKLEVVRIGYLFAAASWGKGYATELLGGFVSWCRNNGKQKVIAGVAPDNVASQRVLLKCGFSHVQRDAEAVEIFFDLLLAPG